LAGLLYLYAEVDRELRDPNREQLYLLLTFGRIEEALDVLRVAQKIDPLSAQVHYQFASVLMSAGRHHEASVYCEKLPADFGQKTDCIADANLRQGKVDDAMRILEPAVSRGVSAGSQLRGQLGCAYARTGRREEAAKVAADSSFNPFNQARIFACLGDKDRTLEALGRAVAAGPFRMGRVLTNPEYALLAGDPRLKALRKKVGLPE
jgi:predicted Zn-dependent protease